MRCLTCSQPVLSGPRAKYCTPACRVKAWRNANPETVQTHIKIRHEKLRAATQVKLLKAAPIFCLVCENQIFKTASYRNATTCSRACAKKRDGINRTPEQSRASKDRAKAKNPNAFKDAAQNNRAMRKSRFKAKVYRAQIYKRDKYLCQLCLGPLFLSAKIPNHPKSDCCEVTCFRAPTIDHIIPLANGGWHEPSNVQAAHFICNSRKSNRSETLETELQ